MAKTALITGSSRGIGRAAAIRLAKAGYNICINCVEREDKAAEAVNEIRGLGISAIYVKADVADPEQVKAMVRKAKEELGSIDVLVSNAGVAGQMQIQDVTREQWDRYFNVNVGGAFNCIQAVLPDMLSRKSGCIVTVSSIWGLNGASCEAVYSATKAALIGLTKSIAMELAPSGIRANCVAPGVILTDMLSALPDGTLPLLADETPLGRLGTPDEIGALIAFLCSEDAGFITGQVITSDGGFRV